MPDPNTRRDKALEDIARELRSIDKHLKEISENTKHRVHITNYSDRPDPFDQPQLPQPGEDRKDDEPAATGAYPKVAHPYFKRDLSDG